MTITNGTNSKPIIPNTHFLVFTKRKNNKFVMIGAGTVDHAFKLMNESRVGFIVTVTFTSNEYTNSKGVVSVTKLPQYYFSTGKNIHEPTAMGVFTEITGLTLQRP